MADKTGKTDTASIVPSAVTITALTTVADKTGKTRPKRLSRSARTYRRRQKQATHKPAAAGS